MELVSSPVTAQSTGDKRAVAVGVALPGGGARRMGGDKRPPRLAARLPAETKLADLVKRHFGGCDLGGAKATGGRRRR